MDRSTCSCTNKRRTGDWNTTACMVCKGPICAGFYGDICYVLIPESKGLTCLRCHCVIMAMTITPAGVDAIGVRREAANIHADIKAASVDRLQSQLTL